MAEADEGGQRALRLGVMTALQCSARCVEIGCLLIWHRQLTIGKWESALALAAVLSLAVNYAVLLPTIVDRSLSVGMLEMLKPSQPIMIDLRNVYRPEEMAEAGFVYEGVVRGTI